MPILLRQLRKKNKWQTDGILLWLDEGDIPADPLENLATTRNALSVYEINEGTWRIERVAAAVTAGSQRNDGFEYIVFDQSVLADAGIRLEMAKGITCDEEVNAWHRDLVEISANKLVALAKRLVPTVESDIFLAKRVVDVLADTIIRGKIDLKDVRFAKEDHEKLAKAIAGRSKPR